MLVAQHVVTFEAVLLAHIVFKAKLINNPTNVGRNAFLGVKTFSQNKKVPDCSYVECWI